MKGESVELASEALRRLRDAMSETEAPPAARVAALAAYRSRRSSRRWIAATWAAAAVAACVVLAVMGVRWFDVAPAPAPRVATAPPPAPPVEATVQARVEPKPQSPRPRRARAVVASRKPRVQAEPAREVASDFLAIPFAPPLDPADGGQVIRVRLPRSALRTVGLPVDNGWRDRIPADVVVGGDGIARAVRFVGFTK